MAPLRVSTTKSEWLPDDPTAFVPTRLWKLPFITTWDDSRNQNRPTDSAEEAIFFPRRRSGETSIRNTCNAKPMKGSPCSHDDGHWAPVPGSSYPPSTCLSSRVFPCRSTTSRERAGPPPDSLAPIPGSVGPSLRQSASATQPQPWLSGRLRRTGVGEPTELQFLKSCRKHPNEPG